MKKQVIVAMLVAILKIGFSTPLFAGGGQEAPGAGAQGAEGDPWKAFAGTELSVIAPDFTYVEGLSQYIGEFEELTGMTVALDVFNETNALQKMRTELASGSGAYDVVWAHGNWNVPHARSGWIRSVDELIEESEYTMEDVLQVDDFLGSLMEMMRFEGELYGLPWYAATIMTYYRTDVFEEHGLTAEDIDDIEGYVAAVKSVHSEEITGVTLRGGPNDATWHWTVFLKGLGGSYVRDIEGGDYYPTLNTPAAIQATRIWGDLLGNYSIPDAATAALDQVVIAMQQGNTAIVTEGAPLGGRILDPNQSKVLGKVGFTLVPEGPGGRHPAFTGHGFAIASASKNTDAAWLFLQWATSRDLMKKIALNSNHVAVSRNSVWEDADFVEKWNLEGQGDFIQTFQRSLQLGDPNYRPRIEGWPEIDLMVGKALNRVIVGDATAEEAMNDLQEDAVGALRRLNYID